MKNYSLITAFCLLISSLQAQTTRPLVLSNGGLYQLNGNYSNSVTIGEPVIKTLSSGNYIITQGFQQPSSAPKILGQVDKVTACMNDSVVLKVKFSGGGTLSFQWNKNGSPVLGETDSLLIFKKSTVMNSGYYTCKIHNTTGDVLSDTITFTVNPLPFVSLNPQAATCYNSPMFVIPGATPSGGIFTGTGVNGNWFNPALSGTGTFNIIYSYTDQNNCTASATQPVLVKNFTATSLSPLPNICVNAQERVLEGGLPAGGSYFGTGVQGSSFNPGSAGTGIHTVFYKYTNEVGCPDTASQFITVKNITPVGLSLPVRICENGSVLVLSGGSPAGGIYSGPGVNGTNFNPASAGAGDKLLLYTYSNADGCINSASATIHVQPPPPLNLGPDKQVCSNISVTLQAPVGFRKYEWSLGTDTTRTSILVPGTGTYTCKVTDQYNCSKLDTIKVVKAQPYDGEGICLVTVNKNTGRLQIIWNKTPDKGISSYRIWREIAGVFNPIASIPFEKYSVFTDTTIDPRTQPFKYKISVIDTCGNESVKSPYHKTLFLTTARDLITGGIILNWKPYEYEGGSFTFKKYYILKGTNSYNLIVTDSAGPTDDVKLDLHPNPGKAFYLIGGVKEGGCQPSGSLKAGVEDEMVFSNIAQTEVTGIFDQESQSLVIYPNPFSFSTTVAFYNPQQETFEGFIRDVTGKTVRTISKISGQEWIIYRENLAPGTYLLELRGKETYRGKLIIAE
jgi:hypothetical protein